MTEYRRYRLPGGIYFFTLAIADRRADWLVRYVEALKLAFREEKARMPFATLAWVVLPDHLHSLWRLPPGDADYSNRWRRIKTGFTKAMPQGERISASRRDKGERGIWQRRFWEHNIRDETDLQRHLDYIHFNPVKHGYVRQVVDWPHSSFHAYLAQGVYPADWGGGDGPAGEFGEVDA